jgi:hypothetical protein
MALLVFSPRHHLLLHLPGPGPALPAPALQLAPLLLAQELLGEAGERLEALHGPGVSILWRVHGEHTFLAVGDPGEDLAGLLAFLLSSCRRLCGPDLGSAGARAPALACLAALWRGRASDPALMAGSLAVRLAATGPAAALTKAVDGWTAGRRRTRLPVHLLLLDGRARLAACSAPSLPGSTLRWLQHYVAARLQDSELGEDGALSDTCHSLPEDTVEVLHLRLSSDWPCSPVVARLRRAPEGGVAVALLELGDSHNRLLLGAARRCLEEDTPALRKEILVSVDAVRRVCGDHETAQELAALASGLRAAAPGSLQAVVGLDRLRAGCLRACFALAHHAAASLATRRALPLLVFRTDLQLHLSPEDPALEQLGRRNPGLATLFILNTVTRKSFTHSFGRELMELPAEALAGLEALAGQVSAVREWEGGSAYCLRLLADGEGRLQEGEVPGLHRVVALCIFRDSADPPDLGRVTLALARLYTDIFHGPLS